MLFSYWQLNSRLLTLTLSVEEKEEKKEEEENEKGRKSFMIDPFTNSARKIIKDK